MDTAWMIGSAPPADLRVDQGKVSARHCRLTWSEAGYLLEDLNSTNGTYVNGTRIDRPTRVTRGDAITLGLTTPMPWPDDDPVEVPTITLQGAEAVIGRAADCDIPVDLPMISSRHARLVRDGGQVVVTDLNSANGVWLDGQRINGPAVVKGGDLISLGSYQFRLAIAPESSPVAEEPPAEWPSSRLDPEQPNLLGTSPGVATQPGHSWAGLVQELGPAVCLVLHAAVLALGLVAILGSGRGQSPGEVALVLSVWSVASVWFGLAGAVVPVIFGPRREVGPRWILEALGITLAETLVAWLILVGYLNLGAGRVEALGWVMLGASVGLAIGFLVVLDLRDRGRIAVAAGVILVATWLGCGGPGTWARVVPSARMLTDLTPARWVFEGLLTVWSNGRAGADVDLVEAYFPASSARMGASADLAAMVLMLVGLAGVVGYLTWERGSRARVDPEAP